MQRGGFDSRTAHYIINTSSKMANKSKSICVSAGTRVYYFDINVDTKGRQYLSISEIPTDHSPGTKKRQRIFVHGDNIQRFVDALNEIASNYIKNDS